MASAIFATVPSAKAMSTMPPAITIGNTPA